MKSLLRLFAAVVLVLSLAAPAFAGEMGFGITQQPPAPAPAGTRGEMDTGSGAAQATGASLAEIILGLLGGVLALL